MPLWLSYCNNVLSFIIKAILKNKLLTARQHTMTTLCWHILCHLITTNSFEIFASIYFTRIDFCCKFNKLCQHQSRCSNKNRQEVKVRPWFKFTSYFLDSISKVRDFAGVVSSKHLAWLKVMIEKNVGRLGWFSSVFFVVCMQSRCQWQHKMFNWLEKGYVISEYCVVGDTETLLGP